MKLNWLATTAIVISLGAGSGVAFAQMPDSPQRHEHGAGGQGPSMSRPDVGHSAAGEGHHVGEPTEHAAQPGMREGAEAHQHDMGAAAREQAQSRHAPRETTQTVGQGKERLGRGEHGSPNAAPENRAEGNRAGRETHRAVQQNRAQDKATEMNRENKSTESAKSAEPGRHGGEAGQGRMGRNERQPQTLTGQNQQRRGQGTEHAAKDQHQHNQNQQAAQPSRSGTPTAQQQGTHPAQTTGQARQHEGTGQAQTSENAGRTEGREQAGQARNESNPRGQIASTKVTNQQRTQVADRLRSDRDLKRARSDINIRVDVGERLPERVRPRPLPSDIVDIVPEYRGYDYTVVHDEIAIVNPDTREIVDVIPEHGITAEGGGSYGGGSYAEGGRIVLSREQREILRHAALGSATVGSTGGTCLSLRPVPEELARSNPDLASDKYLAIGDQVVLVNPHDQKIVQVVNY